ncbi:hypothetical protein HCH_05793 [Hahella chejuensis KCTC 2396]|uniref:Uncharacterized protein n=1 Tax=Hahella chejuensis (strain KCTC 2396) TaxID=349521 RepID=Q2SA80_HAHCH|nr:hypothetical protein HCH_05793 [Hahella chejuensis KCTC 2396]
MMGLSGTATSTLGAHATISGKHNAHNIEFLVFIK